MANMQYMQAQATSANTRFVENLGNKAINEINRQYGAAVDDMFERLHKQTSGVDVNSLSEEERKDWLSEIGGGYTRVGFDSKADRDRFVTDMTSNGVEATYATEKVGGQWLVEIPNRVKVDKLKGELEVTVTASGKTGNDTVASQAILKDFTQRTYVQVNDPTPVEIREEADVGTLQTNVHRVFTKHLDELGIVINKTVDFSKQLEGYVATDSTVMETGRVKYGTSGEIEGFEMGRVQSGKTKTAIVLNGDTVLIGGQVVTDEAVREKILKKHEKRMQKAKKTRLGDFVVSKTDRLNEIRADKSKAKGKESKAIRPPISQVYASKKAIMAAAYKQEYVVDSDNVKVAENFKDIQLSSDASDALDKFINSDSFVTKKFSEEKLDAISDLGLLGATNGLSLKDRKQLSKQLHEQADNIRAAIYGKENNLLLSEKEEKLAAEFTSEDAAALDKAAKEIELSEQEKLQEKKTDKNGNLVQGLIKIDFGLAQIEAVAEGLNMNWQIAHAATDVSVGSPKITLGEENSVGLFDDIMKNGGRLDLSNREFNALKKANKSETVNLTAEDRFHIQNALSKYENMKEKSLTADDKKVIEELKGKIALNNDESSSTRRINSIEDDLNIPISSANFTPDKIMDMNATLIDKAQAAGINIFTKNGKSIDVEKLTKIANNPELLKRLGMSKDSMGVMIDVNKAQITNPHLLGGVMGVSMKTISMVARMDESGSIGEVYDAANKIYTGASYAKSGVVAIRNHANAAKLKRDAKRANQSKYGKGKSGVKDRKPKKAPKESKAEKSLHNASSEKLAKMAEKTKKAQEEGLKAAARREKSLVGRYQKTKAKVMTKLANTTAGKLLVGAKQLATKLLIKPIAIVGGVLILIEGVLILLMIAIMTISAFLESINPINIINNALAPDTYADTVAYTIYEDYLAVKEEEWLKEDLQGFDAMYADRVHLRYGSDYEDFQSYMSRFDDIVLKDKDGNGYYSDVYLNPFAASGVSHDGILHKGYYTDDDGVSRYDGSQTVTVGANNNVYGLIHAKDESNSKANYTTTESGHTCNIKDILCMIDVMYGMDLDKIGSLEDDSTESNSLLGMSPAQVSFEDGVDNVVGFFKWLWNTIKSINPFCETQYAPLKDFCNGKVGMRTIIKYAETLYESSHQQEVSLTIEYHNTDPLIVQTESGAQDVSDTTQQSVASLLGYCTDPVITDFYLKWNNNTDGHGARVSPYFTQNEDGTGTQYVVDLPTSETGYKVQIDMSDMSEFDTPCLKNDMASNEATYNYIKGLIDDAGILPTAKSCWEQTKDAEVQNPVTKAYCTSASGGTGYYTRSGDTFTWHEGNGGWYDNEEAAKNAVEADLRTKYDNAALSPTTYLLTGDRNKFTKTFYEKPAFSVDYNAISTSERITGWHEEDYTVQWYWCDDGETGNIATSDWGHGSCWGVRKWNNATTPTEENGQPVWYASYFRSKGEAEAWAKSLEAGNWYSVCIMFENRTRTVSDYSTFYHSSGSCTTVEKKVDEFVRNCDGHGFKYCGGHIGMHSHGIVYSFTNEQIAMSTVRDETNGNPLADGFALEDNGFDNMRGKIIHNEVNYGNVVDAAASGGCASPWVDPQGSISGMYGLNLKLNGTEWGSDYGTRITSGMHMMRDIFDIDTNLLKGDNIFPLKCDFTNYEGWTEDNMTLAILKWVADWYDEYGFDIPQEIWYGDLGTENDDGTITPYDYGYDGSGQAALSTDDIDAIVTALQSAYGSSFDEEREEAVRMTLGFVGRGHYSQYHEHNFLSEACQGLTVMVRDGLGNEGTVTYSGCCTAGDEDDFTNYIRSHFGKSIVSGESEYTLPYTYSSGTSNALPADIVAHKSTDIMSIPIPNSYSGVLSKSTIKDLAEAAKFKTAVFIGIVENDIQLSTGQVIKANAPIVVDLSSLSTGGADGIGNIYLHGRIGNGAFDAVSFDSYEWLYNDTSKTKLKRFN